MVTAHCPQLARVAEAAPPRTLVLILRETAERLPDSSALDDGRISLSYAELLCEVKAYGRRLHQAGIGAGDNPGGRPWPGQNVR
jgi:non-ribosomal peptide synthetase component E (peptide arylation enzyme)